MHKPLGVVIGGILLSGCGGSKDIHYQPSSASSTPSSISSSSQPAALDYSHLELTPQLDSSLVLADEAMLGLHIKNGLRLNVGGHGNGFASSSFGSSSFSTSSFAASSSSTASNNAPSNPVGEMPGGDNYTDTNVHVVGVDEADYAKYDGKHWFVATRSAYRDYFLAEGPGIQIAATDPATATLEVVSSFELDAQGGDIDEMYLVQDAAATTHLAVITKRTSYEYYPSPIFSSSSLAIDEAATSSASVSTSSSSFSSSSFSPYPPYRPSNGHVDLRLINVQDPASPAKDWEIQIDGRVIDSRRVDDVLYLVTRFNPWIENLHYDYGDGSLRGANEDALEAAATGSLMPHYQIGDTRTPLTTECYIQSGVTEDMGLAQLVHITAIDLKSQKLISSQCLNSPVGSLSMTRESLYLTGTAWGENGEKTVVHKFSLAATGPEYAASGSVQGAIGRNSDPAFRLHEHEGDLRIVTTEWLDGPLHRLFILEEADGKLEVAASLPNSAEPAPIGKPGEDIYSVRFEGERAYIVTFRRTDPLYAIDLSDRLAPKVIGELEIPGFATYMHVLNERYLFTFGQHADENGVSLGLKAELIDVAGDNPVSVQSVLFGDFRTRSEALHNLRALSLLKVSADEWRIALPISLYTQEENYYTQWQYTGLQLLSVSGLEGEKAQLSDAGVIVAENEEKGFFEASYGVDRSVLHGDAVFYAHNNAFWSAAWGAPDKAVGPIAAKLVTCSEEVVYGLKVSMYSYAEGFEPGTACEATVTATDGDYSEVLVAEPSEFDSSCQFVGAAERAGDYVLKTELPGFTSSVQKVSVRAGRCHVQPQYVEAIVAPRDPELCAGTVHASLSVGVQASGSAPVDACSAVVEAVQGDMRYTLTAWQPDGSTPGAMGSCHFTGPDEIAGEMTLEVSLEGYAPYIEEGVFVPESYCHVETQHRDVVLDPAM